MTWGEIKLTTLRKMFAADGDFIVEDAVTAPYLKAMSSTANEALSLISAIDGFNIKSVSFIKQVTEGVHRVSMKTLAPDFRSLIGEIYCQRDNFYQRFTDYRTEGNDTLVFPATAFGTFTVYYNAHLPFINDSTPDSQVLNIPETASLLLPLYMASQIYKDDNFAAAVQLRNEFEAGFAVAAGMATRSRRVKECFLSKTGWV